MKYRTKLYLSFTSLSLLMVLLSLGWFYVEMRKMLFNELRSKVTSVAATAAASLDGDLVQKIQKPEDASTPEFEQIAKKFLTIRNSNRRSDIYVIYIYTLLQDPDDPNRLLIGIEATDENPDIYTYTGENYPEGVKYGFLSHLKKSWASSTIVTDRWGKFLSALSPIYNSKGEYVATLGIDLSSQYISQELKHFHILALIALGATVLISLIMASLLSHLVTRSLTIITRGVDQIKGGDLKTKIFLPSKDEFGDLANALNAMVKGLEEHERVKLNFVRYVSKHVLEKILLSDHPPVLKGEKRKITILFSDIRGFTYISEKISPEEVVSLLNEYLSAMLDVIFENNGTLDKFIGDGLMVEFGAPLEDAEQEIHAVKTAIEMQQALQKLNAKWKKEGRPSLEMGIGLHTGLAVVGNIGSEKRMEYTAVGDPVNVASRLEQATKEYKTPILMSEATMQGLHGKYPTEPLGPVLLPGRVQPIIAHKLSKTI